jgi:VIT1/CCC1 family predicted Fe2+/Mn2+ transporter
MAKRNNDHFDHDHRPDAIRRRLEQAHSHDYLPDAVLGAIDGTVTTFAVVAGSIGAGFSSTVAIVLGLANLLADGFSMAVSNFQATRSEHEKLERARRHELQHIEQVPEGEREEIRQIYARKGFKGEALEVAVDTITRDRDRWVNEMLVEEFGLRLSIPGPLTSAVVTFAAFCVVGLVPLLPFMFGITNTPSSTQVFAWSAAATATAFFATGCIKGKLVQQSLVRSGIETLLMGGTAAAIAYFAGSVLMDWFA